MAELNAKKMDLIEKERELRKIKLQQLVSTPFDVNNAEHMAAIKQYSDSFELSVNLMYLYQAMSACFTVWGSCWIAGLIIPMPTFITSLATATFWGGLLGFGLNKLSLNDFSEQRSEMKELYNWCFKKGKEHVEPKTNNDQLLNHPEAQRMIKLMAPWCKKEFMLAWEPVNKTDEQTHVISNVVSAGYLALKSTCSMFSASQEQINTDEINKLKKDIESRAFDLNTFKGAEQALSYFYARSAEVPKLVSSMIQVPLDMIKEQVPAVIQDIACAKPK